MRLETRIGGTIFLLDASREWWDEKLKDSVAIGDQSMAPSQFQNNSIPNDVELEDPIEGKGDSDEINKADEALLFPTFPQSSSSKRKKNKDVTNTRSTMGKSSTFEEKLDVVMEAISIVGVVMKCLGYTSGL